MNFFSKLLMQQKGMVIILILKFKGSFNSWWLYIYMIVNIISPWLMNFNVVDIRQIWCDPITEHLVSKWEVSAELTLQSEDLRPTVFFFSAFWAFRGSCRISFFKRHTDHVILSFSYFQIDINPNCVMKVAEWVSCFKGAHRLSPTGCSVDVKGKRLLQLSLLST